MAAGVFAGRSLLPHLNAAKQSSEAQSQEKEKFETRPAMEVPWISQAKTWAAKVQTVPPGDLPALWQNAATSTQGNLQGLQLALLADAWQNRDSAAAQKFLPSHSSDSAWAFLQPPLSATAEPTGPTKSSPAVQTDGLVLANIPQLRAAWTTASEEAKPVAAEKLGQALGALDSTGAAAWAYNLPDGPDKPAALRGVAAAWAESEPFPASEWIISLPEGPLREAAAVGFVRKTATSSPRLALPWALTLTDATLRQQLMDSVLKGCAAELPDAAKEILTDSTLDSREKEDYLESLASYALGGGLHP